MTIYVVRNREGHYFHAQQGFGGAGYASWTPEFQHARLYSKLGMAKRQVTSWFGHSPELGCPTILAFHLDPAAAEVINLETDTKVKLDKARAAELKRKREHDADLVKHYAQERDKLDARIKELSPSVG